LILFFYATTHGKVRALTYSSEVTDSDLL